MFNKELTLDLLPTDIQNIINEYKMNLELLDHKEKFEKTKNIIKMIDLNYFILNEREFIIGKIIKKRKRFRQFFSKRINLEDNKWSELYKTYIKNGLMSEESECITFDFKYEYGEINIDSTEDIF